MSRLDELFARDPLQLSSLEIDEITAYFRQERARYIRESAAKPAKRQKLGAADISLEELFS